MKRRKRLQEMTDHELKRDLRVVNKRRNDLKKELLSRYKDKDAIGEYYKK